MIIIFGILSFGARTQEIPNFLYRTLESQTDETVALRQQNAILQKQIAELLIENSKLKAEIKEDKFVIDTVDFLTKGAVASRWANPTHIRYVKSVCKKYEYLTADINKKKKFANWTFIFARCLATGLDPNYHSDDIDKNGKYDNGIADLNDVCLKDIERDLPKELKGRSWFNIEKSVAGLYIWIKQRDGHMPWAELGYEQWQFYSRNKDQ